MIISGTPKRVIIGKTNARAQSAAEIAERGTASIHLDVQSLMVKIYCNCYCIAMGPPNQRKGERNAVGGWGCAVTEFWHGVEFCSAGSEGYFILGKTAPDIS